MSPHAREAVIHAAQLYQQKHGTSAAARRVFVSGYLDEDRSDLIWDLLAEHHPADVPDPSAVSGDLSVIFREGFRPSGLAGELARRLEADRSRQSAPAEMTSNLNGSGATLQRVDGAQHDTTNPQES